jgi:hypothetical protein
VPYFEHVIIVIQENRTPDNLFGAGALVPYPSNLPTMGTGVDLRLPPTQSGQTAPSQWCLGACFDPDHGNKSWTEQYNGGGTYLACKPDVATSLCSGSTCNGAAVCVGSNCNSQSPYTVPSCPQETYVSPTWDNQQNGIFDGVAPILPYFDIAHKYGFANYFFQTNQGPSQPAHDFLFGGTSAPAGGPGDPLGAYYTDFASDNPTPNLNPTGCGYTSGQTVFLINSTGDRFIQEPPCFEHRTLSDLLELNSLSWRYYAWQLTDIWTPPNGIQHICGSVNGNGVCQGTDFSDNVITPDWTFFGDLPLGTNLPGQGSSGKCKLPNVTWLIPNGTWSDHPGMTGRDGASTDDEYGPNWVAAIVNAVGNATCIDEVGKNPWEDTVILVVWDDWGGFYDHIQAGYDVNWNCSAWGCGYTYGFRVPFLLISKYTPDGYVSGPCTQNVNCPNTNLEFYHDFGSILGFIENNFGLGIGNINSVADGGSGYLFADNYAPEAVAGYPPLGDFFCLYQYSENYCGTGGDDPKAFEPIRTAGSYGYDYFLNYTGPLEAPDNDAIDTQN